MFLKKGVWRPVPYQNRYDLTDKEMQGIDHYKDLVNPQYRWDDRRRCNEEDTSLGIDCFMVNQVLRGIIPESAHSKRDLIRYNTIVLQLDAAIIVRSLSNAIGKSHVGVVIDIMEGLSEFDELRTYRVGSVISDKAFGSFTTFREKAVEYAGENRDGELIIFYLRSSIGDSALYITHD